MYRRNVFIASLACLFYCSQAQPLVVENPAANNWPLVAAGKAATVCVDDNDHTLVKKFAAFLQRDLESVTGSRPELSGRIPDGAKTLVIVGTIGRSGLIGELVKQKKIDANKIRGKWEAYLIQSVANPFKGVSQALVIAGSDRRGTAYALAELLQQIGVSPWYWWADVPVKTKKSLYVSKTLLSTDSPLVKYRGIFINDEAPALSGWTREKFGGFNHHFYEKVFELIIRLKGNYLWPAMWGNKFYYDDSLNMKAADDYGVVIGTSHHEPLMRAHDEWRILGKGKWDYDSNEVRLKEFWRGGMQRATNEKIVTVGMRGDGDAPMSRQTATALLERIVKDQREIIEEVTGRPAEETPQLWALYKEVQDYYDKGMRVPDDVTLLLCDDNWGNIRKLPKPDEKPRKGGYGIYYHFDYVGGPRNYKWVNTNPIPRVWEQMHLAWEYKARQIWIVNVGDIKPMEFPISFFLDYAWNPTRIGAADLKKYTERWCAEQFGKPYGNEIADVISKYAKYNGRRKPELLDANTYHLVNYDEADRVTTEWTDLLAKAEAINDKLPGAYRDAYFQLALHPVRAVSNLQQLYTAVAKNRYEAARRTALANQYADLAKEFFGKDSLITRQYHALGNGKWNHMMDQTHIGYTYWQQPARQRMPEVKYVPADSVIAENEVAARDLMQAIAPTGTGRHLFFEKQESGVSIEAAHFTRAIGNHSASWKVLPDHGRTGDAVTVFPVTAASLEPGGSSPHLEYEVYTYSKGDLKLHAYFSPTLNFHNTEKGLRYAVSIDDEVPRVVSINSEDRATGTGIWNKWVAENIIIKTSDHNIKTPGKHTVRFWMVDPAVVLQKLVLDFGETKPSYLGPPETIVKE